MSTPLTRSRSVALSAALVLAIVLSALALGAAGAAAGGAKTHRFTLHARLYALDQKTSVGALTGGASGKWGAQIAHGTLEGAKLVGTQTAYNRRGALFGPFTITITPKPDGSVEYNGTAEIKGGTGLYRGAHGVVKTTGTRAPGAAVDNFSYKVTLTY